MKSALAYVEIERRASGFAIIERRTREVLDLAPDELAAGKRAATWERVFTPDGQEPQRVELVSFDREVPKRKREREARPLRELGPRVPRAPRPVPGLRDPRARLGRRVPLTFDEVVANSSDRICVSVVQCMPQFAFRGAAIHIPEGEATPWLDIGAPIVGYNVQIAGGNSGAWYPATMFARFVRWTFEECREGNTISFQVRNRGDRPLRLLLVVMGNIVERIELAHSFAGAVMPPATSWSPR